jgi:hypothetical protein
VQLAIQEVEQAGVTELLPPALAVKLCQGEEEVCHRAVLAAEEVGEVGREQTCGIHVCSIANRSDNHAQSNTPGSHRSARRSVQRPRDIDAAAPPEPAPDPCRRAHA